MNKIVKKIIIGATGIASMIIIGNVLEKKVDDEAVMNDPENVKRRVGKYIRDIDNVAKRITEEEEKKLNEEQSIVIDDDDIDI